MTDLRSYTATCLIAFVAACGDDTSNDTQTGSASNSTTLTGGSGSESGSASTSVTTQSTTASETSSSASGSSSGETSSGTTTAATTGTESSSGAVDGSSSSDAGSSSGESGMQCSMDQQSCANGEACCAGLDCCAGQPIPMGQEYCSAGPCPVSDRNKKENFAAVDPREVLAKVAALPITTWNYTFEDASVRHIGPMAQDFQAAFAVGATDKMIFQIDADGVVLASVQALHGELEAVRAENAELRERLTKLERALARR
jgi:Chaperone of endosialidase